MMSETGALFLTTFPFAFFEKCFALQLCKSTTSITFFRYVLEQWHGNLPFSCWAFTTTTHTVITDSYKYNDWCHGRTDCIIDEPSIALCGKLWPKLIPSPLTSNSGLSDNTSNLEDAGWVIFKDLQVNWKGSCKMLKNMVQSQCRLCHSWSNENSWDKFGDLNNDEK